MAFAIRKWETLTQDMVDWIQANPDLADGVLATDLVVGSLERSHLEAVALLQEEFDVRVDQALEWSIQESALHAFGFDRLAPTYALGSVVLWATQAPLADINIPLGTKVMGVDGQQFLTTASATLTTATLQTASIPVRAAETGVKGNVIAGTINRMTYSIPGIDGVTQANPTLGGNAEETDLARMDRFGRWVRTLTRGTSEALEYAALSTGLLTSAKVVEPALLSPVPSGVPYAGLVWLFVDDGTGSGTLSGTVQTAVNRLVVGYTDVTLGRIPGWKAAGVRVEVKPVTPVWCRLRAGVKVAPQGESRWTEIQTNLTAAATAFFAGLDISDSVSYQNLVVALTAADPDIWEVNLAMWRATDATPSYTAPLSATDLDPALGLTSAQAPACRPYLYSGTVSAVAYPEWIQA